MFKYKSVEEFNALDKKAQELYLTDKAAHEKSQKEELELKVKTLIEGNKTLKDAIEAAEKKANDALIELGTKVAKLKEANAEPIKKKSILGTALLEKAEAVKAFKAAGGNLSIIDEKAITNYSVLTETGQFDQVDNTLSKIAVKSPVILGLFKRKKMVGETFSYRNQTTATRNAQGVAKCAVGFSSLTKSEVAMVRVNDVLYKDTMDICLDYMSDYDFVEGEAKELINESLLFLIDTELLLGTNGATSMNSIDNVSSEFSAANVACVLTSSIEKANYSDLILSLATQIDTLGKLAKFKASVAIVNNCDFFKFVQSAKDSQGRYLDPRVTSVNGNTFIGDILIVASTDVPQNELYVLDNSRGVILDRRSSSLSMSTENGDNFVDGFATLLATTRLQFLVKTNDENAFMKCTDVATAITAITK